MHQALPAVGHEIGLRRAPRVQRARSTPPPGAGRRRRRTPRSPRSRRCRRGSERPRRSSPTPSPRRAAAGRRRRRRAPARPARRHEHPEGEEVAVAAPAGDVDDLGRPGRSPSSASPAPAAPRKPGRAGSHARRTGRSRPRRRVARPAPASPRSWPSHRGAGGASAEPERAAGGPLAVTGVEEREMRPLPRVGAGIVLADEVGGDRQALEVVRRPSECCRSPAARTPRATNGVRTPRARARPGLSQPQSRPLVPRVPHDIQADSRTCRARPSPRSTRRRPSSAGTVARHGCPQRRPTAPASLGVPVGVKGPVPRQVGLDRSTLAASGFEGKVGQTLVVPRRGGPSVIAVGIGDPAELTPAGAARRRRRVRPGGGQARPPRDDARRRRGRRRGRPAQAVVEGVLLARYRYARAQEGANGAGLAELVARHPGRPGGGGRARRRAWACPCGRRRSSPATSPTRRLVTSRRAGWPTSPSRSPRSSGLDVEVFDEDALAALGCGGLLGVNAGSAEPPRMIKLTYRPRGGRSATWRWSARA